ncbi:MAG: amino acid adenylation domain-containing protein, partial [Candidatus Cloacimonetes bacterium]|nr:amino acid adenylation domain-containing protein [Candidatus Cloacimonadota bacterium]
KVLVLQYNGQEDSTILSIYAGRNLPQTKNLLGLLTNLFFVRSLLNGDNSLSTQIALENRHCAEAMQNIDYPFEQLLQDLFPKHDKHSEAIARVIFIMQNYPMEAADNAPFELGMKEIGSDASKFDLLFTVEDDAEELLCWFEYRTRLYEDDLILRLAKQYTKLCETYCQAPELPINELQLILPQEMQHLLYELNDTGKDYPANTCYPALWQQNLSLYAQHIAVVCPEGDFSYEELENRSNQLANYLINSGVNHGDIIGICLPRGIWLATAMLAIWKVGAAYLPLDTKYPLQRLSFMLSDAKLRIILGDNKAAETFSSLCSPKQDCRFVSLELLSDSILSLPSAKLPCPADGDSTAYVIYTSGSTGTPKGVLISHKNLINHNFAVIDAFQLNSDDRVLQFGAISFDLSAEEIFPTWLAGATLVFRRDDTQDSVDNFLGLVEEQKISVIDLPTAFWHAIVADLNKRPAPAKLRLCIIGGERALPEKLRLWQDFSQGKIRLLNTYGPTETTIIATLHDATNDAYSEFFPIGKPISNLKAYILNPQQKLMPLGATGELYLGGAGVGKGYLNLPELTSQRFMSNPFINNSSERLYRTGDLVAYSETGELHYVGRADDQVKLLGHRIELGEIAAKLRQHPQVLDAVVILRSESIDHQYLCAYTICTGTPPSGSDLRKHLLQSLPDYMVPAYYANLNQFPLTAHGKIDLKALPEPDQATPVKLQEFVHFYTPEQEVLCRAIAEILQLEQVSIKDNFFELGGNSILSMQLIQKLRHAGLQLGVEQLFRCEDVEELAASLILQSVEDNAFGEFCLVELKKGNPDKAALIFVHSLPGDVLGYVNLIPKLSADLPVYGLQALGLIDPDKTHKSIEEMAKYYLQILKSQRFEQGFSLAGWCFGGRVAVEMALIMRQTSTKVPRVFLFETYAYNPVPSLKIAYKLHRAKQIAKNWKRMPHLLKVKIKDQKGYQTQFTAKEVFQDQGIFKNRSLVRKANVQAIYSCPLKRYPWELILFKARVQHPDMIHDSSLGWKVFAPNITIHEVEATHENILKDPNVEQIAKLMNEYLK